MKFEGDTPVGKVPWPERGDSLFTSSGDESYLARTQPGLQWEAYVVAYQTAAGVLIGHLERDPSCLNLMVFPVVFLYRHYLELRLKSLIRDGCILDCRPVKFPPDHLLIKLWADCRKSIEKFLADFPEAELDAVEATIKKFEKIDPQSMAARYPTDKHAGNSSALLGIEINMQTFAQTMTKVSNFLDSVADEFGEMMREQGNGY